MVRQILMMAVITRVKTPRCLYVPVPSSIEKKDMATSNPAITTRTSTIETIGCGLSENCGTFPPVSMIVPVRRILPPALLENRWAGWDFA